MTKFRSFIKFAGVSGVGWLADLSLLILLVARVGMSPLSANVISSSIAALSVFTVSRLYIFSKQEQLLGPRLLAYWMYTLCVIFTAAVVIQSVVNALGDLSLTRAFTRPVATALAKILVTPPQLLLNFVVARFLIERPMGKNA